MNTNHALFDASGPVDQENALLAASAGTGKTFSIASIFLRMVIDPAQTRGPERPDGVEPREILLVTFTRAATAEMRSRIRERCQKAMAWFEKAREACLHGDPLPDPGDEPVLQGFRKTILAGGDVRKPLEEGLRRLKEALQNFDEITISTIHGFCQRMLIRHAIDSGVPLESDLCDDAGPWVEEIALDAFRGFVSEMPPLLWKVLKQRDLLELWKSTARTLAGTPQGRLAPLPTVSREEVREWEDRFARWCAAWRNDLDQIPPDAAEQVRGLAAQGRLNRNSVRNVEALCHLVANARPVLERQALLGREGMDLDTVTNFLRLLAEDIVLKKNDQLPAGLQAMAERMALHLAEWEDLEAHSVVTGTLGAGLRALEEHLRTDLPRRKRSESAWTYDDLIHRLLEALQGETGEALAREIRQQFRVALIDEFQDTDRTQWAIFRRLFLEGEGRPLRLWLVGDAKQSIYRFRGADIHAYLEAQRTVKRHLDLARNWRTDAPLLRGINRLWSYSERRVALAPDGKNDRPKNDRPKNDRPMMLPFLEPEIPAPLVEAHHADRRVRIEGTRRAPLRLVLLPLPGGGGAATSDDSSRTPEASVPRTRKDVARWTAADIRRTLDAGIQVGDPPQALAPRDIAVLVRSHHEGSLVQRELRRLGIPAVTGSQESVFESEEAGELLRLLECLEQSQDPRSVATVATLRLFQRTAREIDALWENDSGESQAWVCWSRRLQEWRESWEKGGIWRLWLAILSDEELDTLSRIGTWGGERSITNWFHLVEWLQGEATRRRLGTRETMLLLARLVDQQEDAEDDPDSRLLRLESDLDAVQIVTIHSAKGLEYPFAWVPFLWGAPPKSKGACGIWIREPDRAKALLGPEAPEVSPERPLLLPAPWVANLSPDQQKQERAREALEVLQESLRLAYVAMTRPRHEMTLVTRKVKMYQNSPLALVLHGHRVAPLPETPEGAMKELMERLKSLSHEEIREDLQKLVKELNRDGKPVAEWIEPNGQDRPEPWTPPSREREELAAQRWSRPSKTLDTLWFRSSYSTMAQGEGDSLRAEESERQGEDVKAGDEAVKPAVLAGTEAVGDVPATVAEAPWMAEEVPLASVRSGRTVGDFLHEAMEHLDFPRNDESYRAEVLEAARRRHGISGDVADRYREVLPTLLATPLRGDAGHVQGPSVCLGDLPWWDTLRELAFDLPVRGGTRAMTGPRALVGPRGLREAFAVGSDPRDPVMAAWMPVLETLHFTPFHGFLKGTIDLVFRHADPGDPEPRWWVVDYKTSRLVHGDAPERFGDYRYPALLRDMVAARYVLQYHLYLVGLHRFLKWRLPGYDYDRHVGGACYLFVRGMSGIRGEPATGVFVDRPPRERIEAISRVLEGADAAEDDDER